LIFIYDNNLVVSSEVFALVNGERFGSSCDKILDRTSEVNLEISPIVNVHALNNRVSIR